MQFWINITNLKIVGIQITRELPPFCVKALEGVCDPLNRLSLVSASLMPRGNSPTEALSLTTIGLIIYIGSENSKRHFKVLKHGIKMASFIFDAVTTCMYGYKWTSKMYNSRNV